MRIKSLSVSILLGALFFYQTSFALELFNAKEVRKKLGIDQQSMSASEIKGIKIAILDIGFQGYKPGIGDLPSSTELVENYGDEGGNELNQNPHGFYMAQIVWAMTGKNPEGPQFYLLNSNGITNFRNAINFAIEKKVDVILYSQNWEFGGNFDGSGFINQEVDRATKAGIIWVNAAGNYGNKVFNGVLPSSCLRFKNLYDRNQLSLVLSWNDFQNEEAYQTNKDLDFEVLDSNQSIVAQSNLSQVLVAGQSESLKNRKKTLHAREKVTVQLDRGEYCVRIKDISQNFDPTRDRIRLTLISQNKLEDSIDFIDHNRGKEIMIPADNAGVIAVGDSSPQSSVGPTMDGRAKPDVVLEQSEARFTDGFISRGTSNAAAFFAGAVAVWKAKDADLTREKIVRRFGTHLELSDIPPIVFLGLKKYGGIGTSDVVRAKIENGRKVLFLRQDPIEIPFLFANTKNYAASYGMSSSQFRYFIAPALSSYQVPEVDTHSIILPGPVASPSILDELLPNGQYRWIELRKNM